MKKLLVLLLLTQTLYAAAGDKNENAIRTMLAAQVTAWNKGNIEGYMKGYWENDSLLFIGKNGPTYGYTQTLERYKKSYPDAGHMGQLTSTILSIKKLSADYYFVVGKWQLQRSMGNAEGSYTLLLKRIDGIWTIITDHSS